MLMVVLSVEVRHVLAGLWARIAVYYNGSAVSLFLGLMEVLNFLMGWVRPLGALWCCYWTIVTVGLLLVLQRVPWLCCC